MSTIPIYIVHLDAPTARDKWKQIATEYKTFIHTCYQETQKRILQNVPEWFLSRIYKYIEHLARKPNTMVLYVDELSVFADICNVPLGAMILMQVCYELYACCTSAVLSGTADVGPLHFRTLDWGMKGLNQLTVQIEFRQNNKTVYSAITWAGFVGHLTVMKPGVGSISLNYRATPNGRLMHNLWRLWYGYYPAGYWIRDVIERCKSYKEIVQQLSNRPLIAPCYFVVSGTRNGEGCRLIRDRQGVAAVCSLDDSAKAVIQTNIDCVKTSKVDISDSKSRHQCAQTQLRHLCVKSIDKVNEDLLKRFMVAPIVNDTTIFGCVMNARHGVLLAKGIDVSPPPPDSTR